MKSITLIFLHIIFSVEFEQVSAQCPGSPTCQGSYIFCLDELNGFSCTNTGGAQNPCFQPCSSGPNCVVILGQPCKTVWWAFVSDKANISITLSRGICADTDFDNDIDGIIWGITGDCQCNEEVYCNGDFVHPANPDQSWTFEGKVVPCKIYYIWMNGTEGDVCYFTFNTSGGGLCNSDKKGKARIVCPGYVWNSETINTTGTYHSKFIDNKSCPYDSVVDFTVLPIPEPAEVYFISCDNKPFVDLFGRKYYPCQDHLEIDLPNSTEQFKCDSSIKLTAINVAFAPTWYTECLNGKVSIAPNINISNPCNVGETYEFNYRWYKKNDASQTTISTSEILLVDAIDENYCLEVNVKVHLDTANANCSRTFCESFNESEFIISYDTIQIIHCDSAIFNSHTYSQSDSFTLKLKSMHGCDSIIHVNLDIPKSSSANFTKSTCDSITINNILYTQSGNFKQTLVNSNFCDSILKIDLNIQQSSKNRLALTSCDSMQVNGQLYFQTGNYTQILTNTNQCDSILNLDLTIPKSCKTYLAFNSCDSINVNGINYYKSGNYLLLFKCLNGCDSNVNLHINIPNSNGTSQVLTYCDSAMINGRTYNLSGNYTQLLKSAFGCDSILNLDLTISKSNFFNLSWNSCDSAIVNGQSYTQSGNYTQILQNADHCDSLLNINLNIFKNSSSTINISDCDSILVNGQTYKQSGSFIQTLSTANHCDSFLTINFTRLFSSSNNQVYSACDSIEINNQTYKQSGSYVQLLKNSMSCDSLLNLNISISKSNSIALSFLDCDSVVVNGHIYNQSGNYTQTLINSNQCDSILKLNINLSKSNTTDIQITSCDSAIVNGKKYKQTGTYVQVLKNTNQCDSILNLDLNIYSSNSIQYTLNSCDSAIINGQIYKQSGSYIQYLQNIHQCDSTLTIQLNLSKSSSSNISQTVCDSTEINGVFYYSSGHYIQKLSNSNGCDSTIAIDLIIKSSNSSILDAGLDTSICEDEILKLKGWFVGKSIFKWYSNQGSFENPDELITNYIPKGIGDEHLYLTATDDCNEQKDSLTVHVLPKQIVQVTGDSIWSPCKEIILTASGGTNYTWTPSSNLECLDPACQSVRLKSSQIERIIISTDGPCVIPANLNLTAKIEPDIYLPNVFSPNGDNINDIFLPVFNCEQIDYYNLQIFDRWGNLLFESHNKDKGWNGKYQDQPMNPGVYPYVILYQIHNSERKIKAGDVTLVK